MATLKPTVKTKLKTGMYIVYIRVVQNRQSSFIRTSWMVNDKGVKGKEVTDPFVMQQVSNLISSYILCSTRLTLQAGQLLRL